MDPEHFHEARRLAERAEALLHTDEAVSLFRLPAFHDWESISLAFSSERVEVVHRRWRMRLDHEKRRSSVERLRWPKVLEPTIEERRSGIDVASARLRRANLEALTARPLPLRETAVLDGCRYRISTREGTTFNRVEWVGQPPDAWQSVATTFTEVWQQLVALLAPSMSADLGERQA